MNDFVERVASLDFGIDNAKTVFKERRQVAARQVAILVNAGRQHRAAMRAVPRRIIGAAAEERNAKGSSTDDHKEFAEELFNRMANS